MFRLVIRKTIFDLAILTDRSVLWERTLFSKEPELNNFDIHVSVHRNIITANKMKRFLNYLFLKTLYMFQAVPPPIIRSTQLYKQLQLLSTNTAASCYRG